MSMSKDTCVYQDIAHVDLRLSNKIILLVHLMILNFLMDQLSNFTKIVINRLLYHRNQKFQYQMVIYKCYKTLRKTMTVWVSVKRIHFIFTSQQKMVHHQSHVKNIYLMSFIINQEYLVFMESSKDQYSFSFLSHNLIFGLTTENENSFFKNL